MHYYVQMLNYILRIRYVVARSLACLHCVQRHMTDLINTNTSILGAAYRQTSTEPTKRDSLVELLNDILHQAEKTNGFVSPPAIRHL